MSFALWEQYGSRSAFTTNHGDRFSPAAVQVDKTCMVIKKDALVHVQSADYYQPVYLCSLIGEFTVGLSKISTQTVWMTADLSLYGLHMSKEVFSQGPYIALCVQWKICIRHFCMYLFFLVKGLASPIGDMVLYQLQIF